MKEIQSPEAFAEMLRAYDMDVSFEERMATEKAA